MRAYTTLIRGLVLVLLGVLGFGGLGAQEMVTATSREISGPPSPKSLLREKAECLDDPGMILSYDNINVSSNSFDNVAKGASLPYDPDRETIFLCAGDNFVINIQDEPPVNDDPLPKSASGVAYVAYVCPPSGNNVGPSRDIIESDPCILKFDGENATFFSPIDYFGKNFDLQVGNTYDPTPPGDPQSYSYAPVTVDAYDIGDPDNPDDNAFLFDFVTDDGTASGDIVVPQCNNVAIDQLVSVTFLDEVRLEDLNENPGGCSGSFRVRGGVSEFRGTAEYDITLRKEGSTTSIALDQPSNSIRSGDLVTYTVPEDGTYEIVIEDGVSCGGFATVSHTACVVETEPDDCLEDAGEFTGVTIQQGFQSNSLRNGTTAYDDLPDTIFMCLGDSVILVHDRSSAVIGEDPNTPAQAGVAYGLYNPVATYGGPDFRPIIEDPNAIYREYPSIDGYVSLTPPGYEVGDYSLPFSHIETNGESRTRFNLDAQGRPSPIFITVSPFTADSLSGSRIPIQKGRRDLVTGETNYCIDVRTDQRVTLGLLNPITIGQQNTSSCSGSFQLLGGVSEVSANPYGGYTVSLTGPNGDVSLPNGPTGYRHGDVIEYTVDVEGTYTLIAEDQVSCGFTTQFEVTEVCAEEEPEEPEEPTTDITISITANDVSCTGENDGSIVVTATGGTPPYTVTYTRTNPTPRVSGTGEITPNGGSFTFPDLSIGFYDIEILDADGVVKDTTGVQIDEGAPFDVTIETVPAGDCTNGGLATLVAVVSVDGSRLDNPTDQGYSISWSSGETTDTISATPNETYTVTVRNIESDCPNRASTTPSRPSTLVIDITNSPTADATCSGSLDGSATVQVSGGVPDDRGEFQFDWSDGFSARGNRRTMRASLNPGPYTVTVTDVNGCDDSFTFDVAAEKTLRATLDSTQVECFGESNGTISVRASTEGASASLPYRAAVEDAAGTQVAPFQPLPGNGSTPITFEGFAAGTYIVVLQDSDPQQCETRDTIEVTQPEELALAVTTTSPICPEDPDGTALLVVSGGTGPYTYRIINDSLPAPTALDSLATFDTLLVDTNGIEDLQSSPYYFAIIDDVNGCGPDSLQFEIKPRPQPNVTNALITTISCPGDSDGQLSAIATPPPGDSITITDYAWYRLLPDNSQGEQVAVGRTTQPNLTVGAYILEITLSNGCKWPFLGIVDSPGLVEYASDSITSPTCLGDSDGSILLSVTGGTPNSDGTYNYSWSDLDAPITDNARTGLSAGTYDVTITDANNCQPPFDTSFVLTDPVGITGDFTVVENVSCPNDTTADGRVIFSAGLSDGSTGTFDFYWSTGDTILGVASSSQMNLPRGPISVTVTDGICPQVFDTIISSPDEFAFDPRITPATCNGDTTGAAEILVTGGTPGYTFSYVDRPEVTNRLDNVEAGLYQLLVTDANGCQADTFSFVIEQPDSLVLTIDPFVTTPRVTCFGDEDGVLAVQLVSNNNNPLGDSPYTWSPAVAEGNETTATDLAPGTYGVTVTDTEGCQDSLSYTIFEPDTITFTVDSIVDPLCFNDPARIVLDTAFGGQGTDLLDYSFTVNNDGFLTPFDQAGIGFGDSVVISVFDSVGCFSEQTFQIQQPEEIVIDLPNRVVVELGDTLTQLNPLISPGDRNYTYQWTPPDGLTNDSIRDPFLTQELLRSQEYTLVVTDENGCQAIDDVFVEIDANRNIFIPNAFSPNRDGRNDDFRIYACTGVVGITQVNIFNRWGGLLFEQTNVAANCQDGTILWDGKTPDGREVDTGVYVYTVEVLFIDGVKLLYRGDISVVR